MKNLIMDILTTAIEVLLGFLLAVCAQAEEPDLDRYISKLGDDEFDMREAASKELSKLPKEYVSILIRRGMQEKDPEVRMRLARAAREVYVNTCISQDERWQRLHAEAGWDVTEPTYAYGGEGDESGYIQVIHVLSLHEGGPAEGKLMNGDEILKIDGNDVADVARQSLWRYGIFVPGKTYKLDVRRHGGMEDGGTLKFSVEISVTLGSKPSDYKLLEFLERTMWAERISLGP